MTRMSRMDFLDWRLTQTPYNWMPDWSRRVRRPPDALPFCICVIRAIRGEFLFSRRIHGCFCSQSFWKAGLGAQRVPTQIEAELAVEAPAGIFASRQRTPKIRGFLCDD